MKGKGKIHPSPAPPAASGVQQLCDVPTVLSLLPAAILALTAALRDEDKEVFAYLLRQMIEGPTTLAAEERRPCRKPGEAYHRPVFDCGCFDCYTRFWSRWDCSPDREVIHQAIEAFEQHLASSEKKIGSGGRRRRERRAEKGKKDKMKQKEDKKAPNKAEKKDMEELKTASELEMVEGTASFTAKESLVPEDATSTMAMEEVEEEVGPAAITCERRRGWADVIGIFNSRLWGLWSPSA